MQQNDNYENENINQNNFEDDSTKNDLEYNDGLGDLLREKERYAFSWKKTGIVSIAFIAVIGIWLTIILSTGKEVANQPHPTGHPKTVEIESTTTLENEKIDTKKLDDLQEKLAKIEKENLELIGEIDDILEDNNEEDNKIKIARANLPVKTSSAIKKVKKAANKLTNPSQKVNVNSNNFYKIIVGSFKSINNAKKQQASLTSQNIKALITSITINNQQFYRLQAGSFKNRKNASDLLSQLKKKGIKGYIIRD